MPLTPEQIAERPSLMGSSDVAAVVGLNPYATGVDVFNEKRGLVDPFEGNDATRFGDKMEPVILDDYEERFGVMVTRKLPTHRHPELEWAAATPDGLTEREGVPTIVEAKTAGWRVAHRWGPTNTDEVPEEYLVQVQWQMFVLGLDRADIHVVVDREFRTYTIDRNQRLIDGIVARAKEFWENTQNGIPPELDGGEGSMSLLSSIYPEPTAERIEADEEAESLAQELKKTYDAIAALDERKALLKAKLCEKIGDARGMTTSVGSFSWSKGRATTRTDWKKCVEDAGIPDEILARHTYKTKSNRVFRPNWKKEDA